MIFDSSFDAGDAALYGGIIGFIEDSIKAESSDDREFDELADEAIETYVENTSDKQLRLLYNDSPELVHHLIKKAYIAMSKAMEKTNNMEIEAVRQEMLEELEGQENAKT